MTTRENLVPEILRDYITEKQWQGHTLDLGGNHNIGDQGAKALAKWGGTTLKLYDNNIGPEGAKYLAEWKGHTLDLSYNDIGSEGAKALARWGGHTLSLWANEIGLESVKALAKWKGHTLKLFSNSLTHRSEGIKAFAAWTGTDLTLGGGDHIKSENVKAITAWEGTTLILHFENIDPEDVEFITKNWKGINLSLSYFGKDSGVKKRYEESVKLLLNEHICKDITLYVLCKFLDIN